MTDLMKNGKKIRCMKMEDFENNNFEKDAVCYEKKSVGNNEWQNVKD